MILAVFRLQYGLDLPTLERQKNCAASEDPNEIGIQIHNKYFVSLK